MKFKKVTKEKAVSNTVQVVEGIAGGMGSKGIFSMLPVEYQTNLVKGGVAILSVLGAIAVPNKHFRAVLSGVAFVQGSEVAAEELKKLYTGDDKFITASLGQGHLNATTPISQDAWANYRHSQQDVAPREVTVMDVM